MNDTGNGLDYYAYAETKINENRRKKLRERRMDTFLLSTEIFSIVCKWFQTHTSKMSMVPLPMLHKNRIFKGNLKKFAVYQKAIVIAVCLVPKLFILFQHIFQNVRW